MTLETPDELFGKEPLSEVTQKHKRNLLAASVVALAMTYVGLVPTRITAFGIEASDINAQALLNIALLIVVYFLVVFLIHATPDFLSWHRKFLRRTISLEEEYQVAWEHGENPEVEEVESGPRDPSEKLRRLWTRSGKVYKLWWWGVAVKVCFELGVPILASTAAIVSILSYER